MPVRIMMITDYDIIYKNLHVFDMTMQKKYEKASLWRQ